MTVEQTGGVQITLDDEGRFEDVCLRNSALADVIAAGSPPWSAPILLYGQDVSVEIEALIRTQRNDPWLNVRGFRDLVGRRRHEFVEMEERFDRHFYPTAQKQLGAILLGNEPFDDLVDFVAIGPSRQGVLSRTTTGRDFVELTEFLCNTTGLILPWQTKEKFLSAFVLAVWLRHPRLFPLVLHFPKRFGVPPAAGIEVPTGALRFESLAEEAERVFGMTRADVEQAYRVWQLSRSGDQKKPQATTPQRVTQEVAREFLGVVSRARSERSNSALVPQQKPAPIMFELDTDGIGVRHGVSTEDVNVVIRSGASSLERRVRRLEHDAHVANVVPSSREMFEEIATVLERIHSGNYDDGDVVALGLELNALQWHVDAMRTQLGDTSIGELTGLFATASLFLGRFSVWQDYTGTNGPTGKAEEGVAAFQVALDILKSARDRSVFLTPEASARVGAVLARTAIDEKAPPLREGLIRSGENLAAVTAEGLSRVVIDEAKSFEKAVKTEAYKQASTAIVKFAAKNAAHFTELGQLRHWPWLTWLHSLLGH